MSAGLRRLSPIVAWVGYVLAYHHLVGALGQYAEILGLLPVAASGAAWGLAGGSFAGLVGFAMVRVLASGQGLEEWVLTYTFDGRHGFELLAFIGTGACVAFIQRFRQTIAQERQAAMRAQVDPLTGAFTRGAFEERLSAAIERASRDEDDGLALLFVDLDRFKFVNDTYGHEVGDKLLREVGRVLRENVRGHDLVGRVGGDEFTVALLGVREERAAAAIARGLVRELNAPIRIDGRDVQVSASIGIALCPRDGTTPDMLLKSADAAMYEVKEGGKNSYYFSTVEVRTRLSRRLELERQLRQALHENELEVLYQPQVRLSDNRLVGFEALLRWHSPELGIVSPGEFIPVAEEAGLISPIGHWLLRDVALRLRDWLRAGYTPVKLAVNVSTMQFHQKSFVDTVRGALDDSGIPPELLEIEVTESVLVRDYDLALRTLMRLDRLGVPTALDDFGTGYSSLAYLQRLPIRTLKIDRSFVQGLAPQAVDQAVRVAHPELAALNTDPGLRRHTGMHAGAWTEIATRAVEGSHLPASTFPIVEAICAMAHKLDKHVVAEGIETAYQRDFL
ncbi:MAG TPA: EAL domain-containing protein, partial [Trueperaceae bacterium]